MTQRRKISKKDFDDIVSNMFSRGYAAGFSNLEVDFDVNFTDSYIQSGYATFNNSLFKGKVDFSGAKFPSVTSFIGTHFDGEVSFDNAKFEDNARFNEAQFKKKVTFENTTFQKLADFYYAKFYQKQIFLRTDFKGTTVFSRTIFCKNVLFTFSLLGENTIFRHATFERGFDLSLAANISGDINLFHIDNDLRKYTTKQYKDIDEYEQMVYRDGEIPIENKRETLRIFKDQLIKQNNKIDALEYHKFEMQTYTYELEQKAKIELAQKRTNKSFWRKTLFDLIINSLNNISNKHGSNWGRGVVFTFLVGLFFYCLMLLCLEHYTYVLSSSWNLKDTLGAIGLFSKYFFEFILPFHKFDMLDKPITVGNSLFYLWDFLGRVFISYGIYQTISAFRKFNK